MDLSAYAKTLMPPPYPLAWPDDWKRKTFRVSSRYSVTEGKAWTELRRVLELWNVAAWTITSNLPLRLDGLPLRGARVPSDPGVAVWWIGHREADTAARSAADPTLHCLAVDQYDKAWENARAIYLAIEALRALSRAGASQILDRTHKAFVVQALPSARPAWAELLGLTLPTTDAEITAAYRREVKVRHPDQGGSTEAFMELERAVKLARAHVAAHGRSATA